MLWSRPIQITGQDFIVLNYDGWALTFNEGALLTSYNWAGLYSSNCTQSCTTKSKHSQGTSQDWSRSYSNNCMPSHNISYQSGKTCHGVNISNSKYCTLGTLHRTGKAFTILSLRNNTLSPFIQTHHFKTRFSFRTTCNTFFPRYFQAKTFPLK